MVFDKNFFIRYQKILLFLLNHPITRRAFRFILRIRLCDCPKDQSINRIEPHAFWYGARIEAGQVIVTADFRNHDKYAKRLYHAFKPLWYLFHAWDVFFANVLSPRLNLGFDTLTVYPQTGGGGGNVSCDGYVGYYTNPGTWAATHDYTGSSTEASNSNKIRTQAENVGGYYFGIRRSMMTFDTSALTNGAGIISANLSLYGESKTSSAGGNQNIYSVAPTAANNIVTSDFSYLKWGTTIYAPLINTADINLSGYNVWELNATGLLAINRTGVSKFGIRSSHDALNSSPSSGQANSATYTDSEYSGTSRDPRLVVTYTAGAIPNADFLSFFFS